MLEILEYSFIQRAFLCGIIIAITCSFVGCFLVMRRLALFGDGIAHVAFGGVAAGLFTGVHPIGTAFIVAILGSIGLQKMRHTARIPGEVAVAIILTTGLATGVVITSMKGGFTIDIFSFLFGSIILVPTNDAIMIASVCSAVLVTVACLYRKLLLITFNEEMARVSGIRVTVLNYIFVALAAVTVVASMRLTGILLITSLLVMPTLAASRFNRGFWQTILISSSISSSAVISGIFISYILDWAPSGTIVLLLVAVMVGVHLLYRIRSSQLATT